MISSIKLKESFNPDSQCRETKQSLGKAFLSLIFPPEKTTKGKPPQNPQPPTKEKLKQKFEHSKREFHHFLFLGKARKQFEKIFKKLHSNMKCFCKVFKELLVLIVEEVQRREISHSQISHLIEDLNELKVGVSSRQQTTQSTLSKSKTKILQFQPKKLFQPNIDYTKVVSSLKSFNDFEPASFTSLHQKRQSDLKQKSNDLMQMRKQLDSFSSQLGSKFSSILTVKKSVSSSALT